MTVATLSLTILAAILLLYAWRRNDGSHRRGIILGCARGPGWLPGKRCLRLAVLSATERQHARAHREPEQRRYREPRFWTWRWHD